jgi:hypothetical protein
MLETPVTSNPEVVNFLSNLPAYRTGVAPLLRGVEVGLAHGFLLPGPFIKVCGVWCAEVVVLKWQQQQQQVPGGGCWWRGNTNSAASAAAAAATGWNQRGRQLAGCPCGVLSLCGRSDGNVMMPSPAHSGGNTTRTPVHTADVQSVAGGRQPAAASRRLVPHTSGSCRPHGRAGMSWRQRIAAVHKS